MMILLETLRHFSRPAERVIGMVSEVGREREGKQRQGNNLVLPNEMQNCTILCQQFSASQ